MINRNMQSAIATFYADDDRHVERMSQLEWQERVEYFEGVIREQLESENSLSIFGDLVEHIGGEEWFGEKSERWRGREDGEEREGRGEGSRRHWREGLSDEEIQERRERFQQRQGILTGIGVRVAALYMSDDGFSRPLNEHYQSLGENDDVLLAMFNFVNDDGERDEFKEEVNNYCHSLTESFEDLCDNRLNGNIIFEEFDDLFDTGLNKAAFACYDMDRLSAIDDRVVESYMPAPDEELVRPVRAVGLGSGYGALHSAVDISYAERLGRTLQIQQRLSSAEPEGGEGDPTSSILRSADNFRIENLLYGGENEAPPQSVSQFLSSTSSSSNLDLSSISPRRDARREVSSSRPQDAQGKELSSINDLDNVVVNEGPGVVSGILDSYTGGGPLARDQYNNDAPFQVRPHNSDAAWPSVGENNQELDGHQSQYSNRMDSIIERYERLIEQKVNEQEAFEASSEASGTDSKELDQMRAQIEALRAALDDANRQRELLEQELKKEEEVAASSSEGVDQYIDNSPRPRPFDNHNTSSGTSISRAPTGQNDGDSRSSSLRQTSPGGAGGVPTASSPLPQSTGVVDSPSGGGLNLNTRTQDLHQSSSVYLSTLSAGPQVIDAQEFQGLDEGFFRDYYARHGDQPLVVKSEEEGANSYEYYLPMSVEGEVSYILVDEGELERELVELDVDDFSEVPQRYWDRSIHRHESLIGLFDDVISDN